MMNFKTLFIVVFLAGCVSETAPQPYANFLLDGEEINAVNGEGGYLVSCEIFGAGFSLEVIHPERLEVSLRLERANEWVSVYISPAEVGECLPEMVLFDSGTVSVTMYCAVRGFEIEQVVFGNCVVRN